MALCKKIQQNKKKKQNSSYQLTQATGFKQSMDINSHRRCFDHTAGQRECIPFWQSENDHIRLIHIRERRFNDNIYTLLKKCED